MKTNFKEDLYNFLKTGNKTLSEIYAFFPDKKQENIRSYINVGVKNQEIKRIQRGIYTI